MKILVIGDDGRAHALTWKLFSSSRADVYCGPGNGGTVQLAPQVNLEVTDVAELARWAFAEGIELLVPAGIESLSAGLVDEVVSMQIGVCGPPRRTTALACSRCSAKEFLLRHNLPTPRGRPFSDLPTAEKYLAAQPMPVVLRADHPAGGEAIYHDRYAALQGLRALFDARSLESRNDGALIEEYVPGVPVSFSALCDGSTALPLLPVRTYDRLVDDPDSPLAPGIGAHTGVSPYAEKLRGYMQQHLILPLVAALAQDHLPYWGFLGVDCLITAQGPRITDLRCSLRDLEAQVLLPRLEDDLLPLMQAAIARRLDRLPPLRWREEASVGIGLVAQGYPSHFAVGSFISGLSDLDEGVLAFHHQTHNPAGLRYTPTRGTASPLAGLLLGRSGMQGISTSGGHVLTIVAMGATLQGARGRAIVNAERIAFSGRTYRADIAATDFR